MGDEHVVRSGRARVLFVGPEWYGSNSTSLRNAIIRCGHECLTVVPPHRSLWARTRRRLAESSREFAKADERWNAELLRTAQAWRPDVVLVFRGLRVSAGTLASCPGVLVHYHPDDSSNPANRSTTYSEAERIYDLHVTTKSLNVPELEVRGAKAALFVRCAYDRDWHLPVRPLAADGTQVGFIGTNRPDRLSLIHHMARLRGKNFIVCGDGWNRDAFLKLRATVHGPRFGLAFSMEVARTPVQLGFLNADNRDQHTCRSYEVPASGGVLVAERTTEHMEMLDEGTEALFFSSVQELASHLDLLQRDGSRVHQIAQAASKRVRGERNTYEDRWDAIAAVLGVA